MTAQDYKFEGWLGLDPKSVEGNMVWQEFEPKPWEETDVDIQVTHSGICGSDIHTLRSGWAMKSSVSQYVSARRLGHFGVLFAKALGADRVVGISRNMNKRDEVLKMGADEYIATEDEADWAKKNDKSLDLIVSTLSSSKVPIQDYLNLLKTDGTFVQVGNPDDGGYTVHPITLIVRHIKFTGSSTGSPREMAEMLQLAADHNVHPWVEQRPMGDANQAIVDMEAGKARYRYVLTN